MIEGECFCGAVRYKIAGKLVNARACHCSHCREAFSGASSAYADPDSFTWIPEEENLQCYMSQSEWGLAICKTCGTALCGIHLDKVHGGTPGSVNGDPGLEITVHIFVGSKAPWDHIGGSAPQYQERRGAQQGSAADRQAAELKR